MGLSKGFLFLSSTKKLDSLNYYVNSFGEEVIELGIEFKRVQITLSPSDWWKQQGSSLGA